jgi:xylose isomerase
MNRNDTESGWDTDQFPNNAQQVALALYHIMKAGGFGTGGINFDAKLRRQSLDPEDLLHGHIGALDTCARALLAVERMLADDRIGKLVNERYAGWRTAEGKAILEGKRSLEDLAKDVEKNRIEPRPRSGRQEYLENLVAQYVGI